MVYVLATVGVVVHPQSTDIIKCTHRLRRMLLLRLSPQRTVERALLVATPATSHLENDKNVVPLVGGLDGGRGPTLMYSVFPFRACTLDVETGDCTALPEADPTPSTSAASSPGIELAMAQAGHLRGSTPLVSTTHGYLGIVHRKQDLELGRVYTHKWLLLSSSPPHTPLWLSAPFRLPLTRRPPSEDIQFAAGLLVDEDSGTATISYGVADCFSWFASVLLPLAEIEAAAADGGAGLHPLHPLPLAPAEPADDSNYDHRAGPIRVRWDGPVSDISGFAVAARGFARQMTADPGITLTVRDHAARPGNYEPFDAAANAEIYSTVAASQADLATPPDVTIRLHWLPNFARVPVGALVVYLPWEFEALPATWVKLLNEVADEVRIRHLSQANSRRPTALSGTAIRSITSTLRWLAFATHIDYRLF